MVYLNQIGKLIEPIKWKKNTKQNFEEKKKQNENICWYNKINIVWVSLRLESWLQLNVCRSRYMCYVWCMKRLCTIRRYLNAKHKEYNDTNMSTHSTPHTTHIYICKCTDIVATSVILNGTMMCMDIVSHGTDTNIYVYRMKYDAGCLCSFQVLKSSTSSLEFFYRYM